MAVKKSPTSCSVSEAARWVGVARQTLTAWMEDLEYDYSGGVNVPDLLKRLFARERSRGFDEARKKFGLDEQAIEEAQTMGWISDDEAKRRKLVAQMRQEEIKADEMAGQVIHSGEVADVVQEEYAKVRGELILLPGNIDHLLAMRSQDECRKLLDDEIIRILTNLQADARYDIERSDDGGDE